MMMVMMVMMMMIMARGIENLESPFAAPPDYELMIMAALMMTMIFTSILGKNHYLNIIFILIFDMIDYD